MIDMTSARTFRSSAFQPSEEEMDDAVRDRRTGSSSKRSVTQPLAKKTKEPRRFAESLMDIDDSDEEMPDVATFFGNRPVKEEKKPVIKPEPVNTKKTKPKVGDSDVSPLFQWLSFRP